MPPSLLTFAQAPASPPFGALTPHVRHFLRNPAGVAGLTLLLLMILMAIFAALLFPGDPLDMVAQPLLRPGQDPQFPLGTDALGRNLLAGLVHGARISLLTGFSAVGISLLIGTLVGTTAGYFGGRIDACLLRLTELFQTIPTFLLVIVLVAIGRPSVALIALSIGLASWPTIAVGNGRNTMPVDGSCAVAALTMVTPKPCPTMDSSVPRPTSKRWIDGAGQSPARRSTIWS